MTHMTRSLRTAVIGSLLGALLPFLSTASARPAPPDSLPGATAYDYKDVGGARLKLHVFAPSRSASQPAAAIVLFFGGAWSIGNINQFADQAAYFSRRGMVAVVPDYRVYSRQGTSGLEAMADAATAMRWVKAHAAQLGVDPKRIAAGGGSAGGQLALSTALMPEFADVKDDRSSSARPDALVLFNPVVDVSKFRARFPGKIAEASPLQRVAAGMPPTLILQGKADTVAPYQAAERFCAEARALKSRCEVVGYEGAPHGFFNMRGQGANWYEDTLKRADDFLTGLGYLPPQATAATPAR